MKMNLCATPAAGGYGILSAESWTNHPLPAVAVHLQTVAVFWRLFLDLHNLLISNAWIAIGMSCRSLRHLLDGPVQFLRSDAQFRASCGGIVRVPCVPGLFCQPFQGSLYHRGRGEDGRGFVQAGANSA